ncbi:nucleoside hydrolase [Gluconacetobacter tumulicola]|uniref:Nucleoside hydrolase n=1 Tax=Gluconacetobacter tumulicola TaxID=1017177 RepID=A0A7W4P5F4_9PROT|nr:nucleoside hydrolase [Gluconacetobacter tumulicola]MBB2178017.1 nucleoside hydrolase [Gluconacetobacter tumulicola]
MPAVPVTVLRRLFGSACLACALAVAPLTGARAAAPSGQPQFVILDNDFHGPGGSNIQSVIPLLGLPDVTILGFTVTVGDAWENAAVAHLLRFLEIAGVRDVPVVPGATLPLVNSRPRLLAWEKANGAMPWLGAWRKDAPDTQPVVPPLKEGEPSLRPATETAALFLIRQVHAHPHQVTIIAAGPMTNIALAIRLDPAFAGLCRRLVFMGGIVDGNLGQVTDSADYYTDFNLMFDPEAADITLTAPFPSIMSIGGVANPIRMNRELLARLTVADTPLSAYLKRYFKAQPMWDELAAAIAVDPAIVKKTVSAYMGVDLSHGPNRGYAHVWPEQTRPHTGERVVEIVTDVDAARFYDDLVRAVGRVKP